MKENDVSVRKRRWRSALSFIILFALLIEVSFWHLTESVSNKITSANTDSIRELALHDLNSIKNSVTLRWNSMEGVVKDIAQEQEASSDELLAVLKTKALDIPSATKLSLLDENGTNYLSNGVVEKDSYLAALCEGKTERFIVRMNTNVRFRENVHEVLFAAIPADFTIGGIRFTWMFCQFPINTLENELKITSYAGEGYSSVIDAEGNYIINISRNHSFMTFDNFFSDLEEAVFEGYGNVAELCAQAKAEAGSAVYEQNGEKSIMVIASFDIADWYFITTVPVSVFDAETKSLLTSFTVLLFILLLILVSVCLLILRQKRQKDKLAVSEAANRSKTEFLFNMSHDIRTPMNAILGYTDIALKHGDDRERVDESLKKIKTSGGHLLNLINDILEMSRIESGALEISESPMDVRTLIKNVEEMSSSLAIKKSIDFKTETSNIRDPYIYFDELHANEVLINLISNAVKYTFQGGKVTLRAEQLRDVTDGIASYRFTVADNGIGMSEEFQKHLFEAFAREKTSTVSKQEGAGLGLSIVKKIVDLAGGTIAVKSRPQEGSVFTIEIPVRIMDEAAIEKFEAENRPLDICAEEFSFRGKKVLLVEDNEMNREIATEILEEAGLIIDTAEDGAFAVKAVQENGTDCYDFILMDIQMPFMDGYEATRHIRALPGGDKTVIIALSANAFEEDVQKSLAAGMNAHVPKPIDVKKLFETMQGLLG